MGLEGGTQPKIRAQRLHQVADEDTWLTLSQGQTDGTGMSLRATRPAGEDSVCRLEGTPRAYDRPPPSFGLFRHCLARGNR